MDLSDPAIADLLTGASHVDTKTVQSDATLREFVASMLSYRPSWLKALFAMRGALAWILRLEHEAPERATLRPEDVSFTPGERATIFVVRGGEEDRFWVGEAADHHLVAQLCVLRDGATFRVVTIVRYLDWTGPIYFNLIRPFHHLVVGQMAKAGASAG